MFEILLGDTVFYYRFKESGEMFEIMLGENADSQSACLFKMQRFEIFASEFR
jgi:hypothetical protein